MGTAFVFQWHKLLLLALLLICTDSLDSPLYRDPQGSTGATQHIQYSLTCSCWYLLNVRPCGSVARAAAALSCEASTHEIHTKVENPKNLLQQVFYLDREQLSRRIYACSHIRNVVPLLGYLVSFEC